VLAGLVVGSVVPARSAEAEPVSRTVRVSAEVYGTGRTPEQARQEALERARELAVAEVTGIHVSAQQLRLKSEGAAAVEDAWSSLIRTSTEGRIVREDVTHETRLVDGVPVYRVTLVAEVVREQAAADPGFTLDLRTLPDSNVLRQGEPVAVELTASRAGYVTLINVLADGSFSVLFPNRFAADNRVEAGRTLRIPSASQAFEIRPRLSPGRERERERLIAVATLDPVPFEVPRAHAEALEPGEAHEALLTALNRWLVRIPGDRRAEALVEYEVVR